MHLIWGKAATTFLHRELSSAMKKGYGAQLRDVVSAKPLNDISLKIVVDILEESVQPKSQTVGLNELWIDNTEQ